MSFTSVKSISCYPIKARKNFKNIPILFQKRLIFLIFRMFLLRRPFSNEKNAHFLANVLVPQLKDMTTEEKSWPVSNLQMWMSRTASHLKIFKIRKIPLLFSSIALHYCFFFYENHDKK